MNILVAFLAQGNAGTDEAEQVDFLEWLRDCEDTANMTLAELKFAWAEYNAVCRTQQVDYPETEFWYEGNWEPITRW